MELVKDGYVMVSKEEYNDVIRFIDSFNKLFNSGYMVFNRQLNTIRKIGDKLVKPKVKE